MKRAVQAVSPSGGRRCCSAGRRGPGAAVSAIYYVEVANYDLTYHTSEGDFTVRASWSAVEQELPGRPFSGAAPPTLSICSTTQVEGELVRVGAETCASAGAERRR